MCLASLVALWVVLIALAQRFTAAAGSLIAAAVTATIILGVYLATREQARRQTTLDLSKEYYSVDFAEQRRLAERFMRKHADVDWSRNDPYLLGCYDEDLTGHGAVLRFWQRVATLYDERELSRSLAQRPLSRELGR